MARSAGPIARLAGPIARGALALPVAALLAASPAAADPGSRISGRVVRVERAGRIPGVAPRLCELHGDAGTCLGDEPQLGQTLIVLDEQRTIAEVQVVEATRMTQGCANLWSVKTTPRPAPSAGTRGDAVGVIDPALDPGRARVLDRARLPPGASIPDGDIWRAIDRDGDGAADIVVARYPCDLAGHAVTARGVSHCVDVWARRSERPGDKLIRTTQFNLAQCNQ